MRTLLTITLIVIGLGLLASCNTPREDTPTEHTTPPTTAPETPGPTPPPAADEDLTAALLDVTPYADRILTATRDETDFVTVETDLTPAEVNLGREVCISLVTDLGATRGRIQEADGTTLVSLINGDCIVRD